MTSLVLACSLPEFIERPPPYPPVRWCENGTLWHSSQKVPPLFSFAGGLRMGELFIARCALWHVLQSTSPPLPNTQPSGCFISTILPMPFERSLSAGWYVRGSSV